MRHSNPESETGQLVGGPHDGVHFPTNDRFWLATPDQLPEPAQRVYVTQDGRLLFWFTESVVVTNSSCGPLLSRYDLDVNDPGWLYRYAGEQAP